mgnify:CR=1
MNDDLQSTSDNKESEGEVKKIQLDTSTMITYLLVMTQRHQQLPRNISELWAIDAKVRV